MIVRGLTAPALLMGLCLLPGAASAQSFEADVTPLLDSSCLRCHGERTVTPLDLTSLHFDLRDRETFIRFER